MGSYSYKYTLRMIQHENRDLSFLKIKHALKNVVQTLMDPRVGR